MHTIIPPFLLCILSIYSIAGPIAFSGPDTNACDSPQVMIDLPFQQNSFIAIGETADTGMVKKRENRKLIAAILSFPLPFGLLGLHRIYLGTKPYIPFVYIGTIGGCLGIMPLIDFIAIITSKKDAFTRFENNPRVFMWSH